MIGFNPEEIGYKVQYGDWRLQKRVENNKVYIYVYNCRTGRKAKYWVDSDGSLYIKENYGLKKYSDTDYVEEAIRKVISIL